MLHRFQNCRVKANEKTLLKSVFLFSLTLFFCLFSIKGFLYADSQRQIPVHPCDFYGEEELPGALNAGSVITAEDPQGIILGQFTIAEPGQYGFLTCLADDPDTPEDEGAVEGDIISFFIDGTRQQKQAVWGSGGTVRVDLGSELEMGMFNLHLLDMPGYGNYEGNINYSGVAVADMILDYLNPDNIDAQPDLMEYADQNKDAETSASEIQRLLNDKAPAVYNFGSTSTLSRYSDLGIIDTFDAGNQDDCIKQLCHWISYKIPQAPAGKEYVPVAIAVSSNPAVRADSDYKHWMSVVGIKAGQDPFPSLPENASFKEKYHVPEALELYGVYLNDPGRNGLGFHTYITAELWAANYFRPIASGLEGEGKYAAIMEPPISEALPVNIYPSEPNDNLQVVLGAPQVEVSIFIPGWISIETKEYLLNLLKSLKNSPDFAALIDDTYFGEALKNAVVNRCFKVDGRINSDYTIIPFEKEAKDGLATTAAVVVNNQTGQFQMAAADPEAVDVYMPMAYTKAYRELRKKIGWRSREHLVNFWLSSSAGSQLFPGWSIVTAKYTPAGPVDILSTAQYMITSEEDVEDEGRPVDIQILDSRAYQIQEDWIKAVLFSVANPSGCVVSIESKKGCVESYLWNNQDQWLVMLRGSQKAACRVKVQSTDSKGNIQDGGVTYVYVKE